MDFNIFNTQKLSLYISLTLYFSPTFILSLTHALLFFTRTHTLSLYLSHTHTLLLFTASENLPWVKVWKGDEEWNALVCSSSLARKKIYLLHHFVRTEQDYGLRLIATFCLQIRYVLGCSTHISARACVCVWERESMLIIIFLHVKLSLQGNLKSQHSN